MEHKIFGKQLIQVQIGQILDGDLPNIPVGWAVFNPNDRNEVIIGAKLFGVLIMSMQEQLTGLSIAELFQM